jgi:hypothetical protein
MPHHDGRGTGLVGDVDDRPPDLRHGVGELDDGCRLEARVPGELDALLGEPLLGAEVAAGVGTLQGACGSAPIIGGDGSKWT